MKPKIEFINNTKVILSPKGDINFANSESLKNALNEVFQDNYKEVIIDFADVENIDSEGLGRLLLFHKKLKDNNGILIIKNIKSNYVRNLFKTINLAQVIKIEE